MPRKRKLKNVVDQIFVISKEIEKLINKKHIIVITTHKKNDLINKMPSMMLKCGDAKDYIIEKINDLNEIKKLKYMVLFNYFMMIEKMYMKKI